MLMASKKYNLSQSLKFLFISLLGMGFGAKFFGYLTGIYRAIGLETSITIETLKDTGIVYYGGLIGLLITYSILLHTKKCFLDSNALDVLAVCIPLFHSVARIGCFLSGCCYGRESSSILAMNYETIIEGATNTAHRIPVQLVESAFEFVLFLLLFALIKQTDWRKKHILLCYLTIYSIGRFFLEFLRGDIRRGLIRNVSFSQCISVLVWILLIGNHIKAHNKYKIKNQGG